MSHRLGDNAAIARKDKNGTIINVTEAMRREAVAELGDYYQNGATEWNLKGTRKAPENPVFLDIAAKRNCSYAEAEAWYSANMIAEMQKLIDAERA